MANRTHDAKKYGGAGFGFWTVLFLIFLTLKLCGVIDWSWWWITAPLWGPLALVAAIVVGVFALLGLVTVLVDHRPRR